MPNNAIPKPPTIRQAITMTRDGDQNNNTVEKVAVTNPTNMPFFLPSLRISNPAGKSPSTAPSAAADITNPIMPYVAPKLPA